MAGTELSDLDYRNLGPFVLRSSVVTAHLKENDRKLGTSGRNGTVGLMPLKGLAGRQAGRQAGRRGCREARLPDGGERGEKEQFPAVQCSAAFFCKAHLVFPTKRQLTKAELVGGGGDGTRKGASIYDVPREGGQEMQQIC